MLHIFLRFSAISRVIVALAFCAITTATTAFAQDENITAEAALKRLMIGNERFVSGKLLDRHFTAERIELAKGQHPYAVVLACSDSRVPPELVFDESLGKLFVIRVAGHVADPAVLGSVEYAVEHLHAPLLIVLGHENCGAVKATIEGGSAPPNIMSLLRRIAPAVEKTRHGQTEEKLMLREAVRENVRYQMQMAVYESAVLAEKVDAGKLQIVGGVYSFETGKVEMLPASLAVEQHHPAPQVEKPPATSAHKAASKAARKNAAAHDSSPTVTGDSAAPELKLISEAKTEEPAHDEPIRRTFAEALREAFEKKASLILKKSLMMRDENDRCASGECRSIPAGEVVKVLSPIVLNIGGKPQIKVQYKGRPCYVLVDERDFEFRMARREPQPAKDARL